MFHGNKAIVLVATLVLAGCATGSVNKQLDKEVAQEGNIKSRADLSAETTQDLNSARMNPEQRAKLEKLKSTFTAQDNQIRDNALELRAVLVKELLSEHYDQNKVDVIKKRMWDLENKRLSLIYGAIDKANKILGHFEAEDRKFINDFFEPGMARE